MSIRHTVAFAVASLLAASAWSASFIELPKRDKGCPTAVENIAKPGETVGGPIYMNQQNPAANNKAKKAAPNQQQDQKAHAAGGGGGAGKAAASPAAGAAQKNLPAVQ